MQSLGLAIMIIFDLTTSNLTKFILGENFNDTNMFIPSVLPEIVIIIRENVRKYKRLFNVLPLEAT